MKDIDIAKFGLFFAVASSQFFTPRDRNLINRLASPTGPGKVAGDHGRRQDRDDRSSVPAVAREILLHATAGQGCTYDHNDHLVMRKEKQMM